MQKKPENLSVNQRQVKQALIQVAISLAQHRSWQQALAINQQIIATYPVEADDYNRRGKCYLERGQLTQARDDYENALRIEPTNAIALRNSTVIKGRIKPMQSVQKQESQKPIIISEMGYASADGANINPVNYLKLRQAPLDLQEQADCYQAALEVLWGKPCLKGIFWWQWLANPLIWPGGPNDNSNFPYGKPAEEVLKRFYLGKW